MEFIMKLSDYNQISKISYNSNLIAISKDKILNIYELNNEYKFIDTIIFINFKSKKFFINHNLNFIVIFHLVIKLISLNGQVIVAF